MLLCRVCWADRHWPTEVWCFVTSKLPVLLAVSLKLLLLCSLPRLSAPRLSLWPLWCSPSHQSVSALPVCLCSLSPSCLPCAVYHSITAVFQTHSFMGGGFPSFSRRPAPRHCGQDGSLPSWSLRLIPGTAQTLESEPPTVDPSGCSCSCRGPSAVRSNACWSFSHQCVPSVHNALPNNWEMIFPC